MEEVKVEAERAVGGAGRSGREVGGYKWRMWR